MSSFTHEDEERLLAFMCVTRELNIRYGSASKFGSPSDELSTAFQSALDKLGEHITGEARVFVMDDHVSGGAQPKASPKRARLLLWRELRRKYQ